MPQPPYALLRASIASGAPSTGGIVAAAGATCQLSADPGGLPGAFMLRWELVDVPAGFACPAGWSTDSVGVYFSTAQLPPVFTLPDGAHWGKVMPRLTLNNGVSENPEILPIEQLSDTATAISILSPAGLKDLGFNEEEQFSATKLWTKDHKDNLRVIDTFIIAGGGGSGLVVSGTPALDYVPAWNGSGAAWAPDVDGWVNTLNHTTRDVIPAAFTPVGTLVRTRNDGIVWEVVSVGPVVYAPWAGSGGVTSFATRTGAVVPATNDYTDLQVQNTSSVTGTGVKGALNTLLGLINGGVLSVFGRVGAVIAVAGDYAASLITNNSTVPGAHVSDALDALKLANGTLVFQTLAQLITYNVTGITNGTLAALVTPDDLYELQTAPSAAILAGTDGVTIVQPTTPNTVRWVRRGIAAGYVSDWYVNSDTGNDANDASSGSPIKTTEELSRRLNPGGAALTPRQVTNIHLAGATPFQSLQLDLDPLPNSGFVVHVFCAFTSSSPITLSSVVNTVESATAPVRGEITTGAGAFAVGNRVRSTSGAVAGAITYVTELHGGATDAYIKTWFNDSGPSTSSLVNVAPGTTCVVDTLQVTINRVQIKLSGSPGAGSTSGTILIHDAILPFGVDFLNTMVGSNGVNVTGCLVGNSAGVAARFSGNAQLRNCHLIGSARVAALGLGNTVLLGCLIETVFQPETFTDFNVGNCFTNGGTLSVGSSTAGFGSNVSLKATEWTNGAGATAVSVFTYGYVGVAGAQYGFGTSYAVGFALVGGAKALTNSAANLAIPATQQITMSGHNLSYSQVPRDYPDADCSFALLSDSAAIAMWRPALSLITDWYINGSTGNDANDGSIAHPLATTEELMRRLCPGGVTMTMTNSVNVHIAAGTYNVLDLTYAINPPLTGLAFSIICDFTSVTDTLTSVVNTTSSTQGRVTLASGAGLTARMRIRSTSGANVGAVTYGVGALNAANDSFVKTWYPTADTLGAVNVANGTTVALETLGVTINRCTLRPSGAGTSVLITTVSDGIFPNGLSILTTGGSGGSKAIGCKVSGGRSGGNYRMVNCQLTSAPQFARLDAAPGGAIVLAGCAVSQASLILLYPGVVNSACCFDASTVLMSGTGACLAGNGTSALEEWSNGAGLTAVTVGGAANAENGGENFYWNAGQIIGFGTPYAVGYSLESDTRAIVNSIANIQIPSVINVILSGQQFTYAQMPKALPRAMCAFMLFQDTSALSTDDLQARFGATFYIDPTFTGLSLGTESNPYKSYTAAIAAAPSTGALMIQAPYTNTVENVTIPAAGNWEARSEAEGGSTITGNVVCPAGTGLIALTNLVVTGTVTGVSITTGGVHRYLYSTNTVILGAVTLTNSGAGLWSIVGNSPGLSPVEVNGGFAAVSISASIGVFTNEYMGGALSFGTGAYSLFGCSLASGVLGVVGTLLIEDTTFAVAPTFTGAAVVTMDGYSHASAVAAGGITLAGGATLVIRNDVNLSGIQQSGAISGQVPSWSGTAWVATTVASAVSSVFGRTGAVVAVAGDYAASKINNDSATVAGTHVSDALDALKALIAASVTGVSSVYGRTGAVVAAVGDYAASKITNDSTVSGAHVSDALDALKAISGVVSFATRTGAVTPASGDYAASQVTNDSTVIGTGVSGAINTLKAQIAALVASSIGNDSSVTGTTVKDALNTLKTSIAALVTGVSSFKARTGAVVPVAGDYTTTLVTNSSNVVGSTGTDALSNLLLEFPNGIYGEAANFTLSSSLQGQLGLINGTGLVCTIPTQASSGIVDGSGFSFVLYALNSSISGVVPAVGVNIREPASFPASRYSRIDIDWIGTDEWRVTCSPLDALGHTFSGTMSVPLNLTLISGGSGGSGPMSFVTPATGWQDIAGASYFCAQFGPLPYTVSIDRVEVWITPPSGHSVLPAVMPHFAVYRSSAGGPAAPTLIATASDASASVPAYELTHVIAVNFGPVSASGNTFWIHYVNEADTIQHFNTQLQYIGVHVV